jgi:Na+/H+ antiporter NhaD/arsenite permease-like protein
MHSDEASKTHSPFRGPLRWVVCALAAAVVGWLLASMVPGKVIETGQADVPLWLVAPFAVLLLSIAVMPFISERWWHSHFPDVSLALGAFVATYMVVAFVQPNPSGAGRIGSYSVLHTFFEYYSFVALVCGLYVVSGGISIHLRGGATPLKNTAILGVGAILANVVGTTGISMLLLRPFMRLNHGRLRPLHIVLFIMIVSNCGGCLTPVGDPPLYLGFLKGVPFFWTLTNLWQECLFVVGMLLAVYYVYDVSVSRSLAKAGATPAVSPEGSPKPFISGASSIICLILMVACVFIDPLLAKFANIKGYPIGATFQLLIATFAHYSADRKILESNYFSFFPAKEVALLFLGIFMTMIPALLYLGQHGANWGVTSPTHYYFATGALSAVLDNAPTYLNFLQLSVGPVELNATTVRDVVLGRPGGPQILAAISMGAVFFGAMTYIGNGPNFMVRAIAQSAGVRMPSFFGYLGYALLILLPILLLTWLLFIR